MENTYEYPPFLSNCLQNHKQKLSKLENDEQNTNSQELETKKIFGEIEEIEDEVETRFNRLKNFDVQFLPPSDHHYLYFSTRIFSEYRLEQRIKQEWDLLRERIPGSIFVRVYEQRLDLMRAAVVGPQDSDYDHCLFFFDIFFPSNYPSTPPKVHYHSYEIDLNSNLRPDGKVCLSLQETWYDLLKPNGSSNKEKWNAEESNILDVLHEIQNLILNPKPHSRDPSYFPSYAKSGSLKKYNEMTFVLVCEQMIRVLRKPPFNFEDLVMGHFRRRAHPVLLKFKEITCESEVMIILFVKLFKVFERNGTYCKHHLDFLRSRKMSIEEVEKRIRYLDGYRYDEEDLL